MKELGSETLFQEKAFESLQRPQNYFIYMSYVCMLIRVVCTCLAQEVTMRLTASKLRQDVYKILDKI